MSSLEIITNLKDQVLSKVDLLLSNENTRDIAEYFTKIDKQTYNLIGISTVTIVSMWFLIEKLFKKNTTSSTNKKKRKKKKAKSPLQISTSAIDEILKDIDTNLVPDFEKFKSNVEDGVYKKKKNYKKQTKEDPNYQLLYFNEILLKKLMELDEVDTLGNDELRMKRKNAIKYIQDYHKQLDELKKKI